MKNEQKILIVDSGYLMFASDEDFKEISVNDANRRLKTAGVDCLHLITNCTGEKKKPSYRQGLNAFSSGLSK